ncbi:3-isopropylmalate dehydratase small subunit [Microbacterium azadirachtae]|uniref:3-isopropylmalate dehydratase small subunit n=1 Tax=Microbacterium azadirachtae TaxID=582680 RepID=A0A0F0LFI3_9MICO|nr:3-isopropylmalate dehydratase small subunit [Microbacterium azadirachtae]KJL31982.1 3-isopropylmalate dehydratase small subunit [Microbacterium azadirachtae]
MEKFTTHTGVAAPLKRSNVDTDQIIPAVFLKRVTKTGFEDALFHAWRQDPEFVLNQEPFRNASVLVAGPDFGTGSSREHAVWALRDYGFKVVLSPRFADIFRGNSGKQGLLAATVEEADIERIWALIDEDPGREITVDLAARTATIGPSAGSGQATGEPVFQTTIGIDDYTRWRLLEGLDDIGLTLRNEDKIAQFEARRESWRPRTLPIR